MNWMRRKVPPSGAGQRARQRRLADAGHVLDEHVAARGERGDGEAHHRGLAVDDAGDGRLQASEGRARVDGSDLIVGTGETGVMKIRRSL